MAILGIDEVGRGPWAGPLVVGAVILGDPTAPWCDNLNDSKQLAPARRAALSEEIFEKATATALGWVSCAEINELGNLVRALELATRRAVEQIQAEKAPFTEIIIDGNINFLKGTALAPHTTTLIKGDAMIKEISAASIIAKVARDRYMTDLAKQYPGYGFEKHMGYGTAFHQSALAELGPCPEHRHLVQPVKRALSTKTLGDHAEDLAAAYLRKQGHRIIGRNVKTKFYEIDIISTKGNHVYFTEVKYRKDASRGSSLAAVTPEKLKQMTFAATAYLKRRPTLRGHQPLLAVAALSGPDFHLDDWFTLT